MHPTLSNKALPITPEEMITSKYAWLLRWALHFSQNDRAAAEDLVQEAFVKLLLSWDTLKDIDNIEPLLYSYLKYAYLTERRRGQNYSFQSLTTIDFDTLFIRLRMADESDQLNLQNELRSIVAYLIWRKPTAKFASIFLLRFFHGYFPEEIMRICMVTRHAIDLSMRYAREEVKSYLANESRIYEFPRSSTHEVEGKHVAIPAHQFTEELRRSIYAAAKDACPPPEQLEKRYDALIPKPLDSELLSHIVSCERCLDIVSMKCGLPPTSKRSPGDALGSAPRSNGSTKTNSLQAKQVIARAIAENRNRLRDIYEHHPSGLMIAVNGQVLAVRDISSQHSVLKVDTHSIDTLNLIEVISEQGLTLLTLPLLQLPPNIAPEVTHEVKMSGGRKVSLHVQFTIDGALIEATYDDPLFLADADEDAIRSATPVNDRDLTAEIASESKKPAPGWRRLLELIRGVRPSRLAIVPIIITACVGMVFFLWTGKTNREFPELLGHAVSAEARGPALYSTGAIHQVVAIHDSTQAVRRDLHRDVRRRRHPKEHALTDGELQLRTAMGKAGVDWEDPLSASSYKRWHDLLSHRVDEVKVTGNNLLTLSTIADDAVVRKESLTIRADDFHPIKRSVEFKDKKVLEIAELSYDIVPWSAESEGWFEPESSLLNPYPEDHGLHVISPQHLSEAQINEAQLHVLLALNQLHADTERIEVSRTVSGIEVKGVVETEARKREIRAALTTISHVTPQIFSYRDMERHSPPEENTPFIRAISVASAPSPLEQYCNDNRVEQETCRQLSYQLLNSATTMVRESNQITDLLVKFAPTTSLTSDAATILNALLLTDTAAIDDAILQQRHVVTALQISLPAEHSTAEADRESLADLAQHNLDLSKELVYAESDRSRPAEAVLMELVSSFDHLQFFVSRLPRAFQADSTFSRSSQAPQP